MRRIIPVLLAFLLLPAASAFAQVPDWVTQILAAAQLPVTAAEARQEGVPDNEVREVLDALRTANVPAHEARDVFDEGRKARREHGPVDNFGAFVQAKLAAGLRGRELAAAIRAEHAARGKGKAGAAKGQSGTKGQPEAKGQAGTKGQSGARGRADSVARDVKGKADAARGKQPESKRPDSNR